MKTFDLKSLLIGVLLTMIAVVVMLVATTNNTPVAWEHKVVFVQEGRGSEWVYEMRLNAITKEGWEVIGIAKDPNQTLVVVMRRAKVVQRPPWWRFWKK